MKRHPVVLDTSTIINLIDVDKLKILTRLSSYLWMVPVEAVDEIHTKSHRNQLRKAIQSGFIEEVQITNLAEIEIFLSVTNRFGESADSACLTLAQSRGWTIASDDKAVIRTAVNQLKQTSFLNTRKILEAASEKGLLSTKEVDQLCKIFFL